MNELERSFELPGGGTVTVSVRSVEPINEKDYMILRPSAAKEIAGCLTDLADTLRPPGTPPFEVDSVR